MRVEKMDKEVERIIDEGIVKRVGNNGEKTLFWTDKWLCDPCLAIKIPRLYRIPLHTTARLIKWDDEMV